MQFKIIAEQSRYKNINITSSEDVWMKGENRLLGLSLEFHIALKIYSNYLYSVFDINENQSRHRFDLGFNYSYNKCTWNFESSLWKNNLSKMDEDEEAMLDQAFDVTEKSRLSCQIPLSDDLDGLEVEIAPE